MMFYVLFCFLLLVCFRGVIVGFVFALCVIEQFWCKGVLSLCMCVVVGLFCCYLLGFLQICWQLILVWFVLDFLTVHL